MSGALAKKVTQAEFLIWEREQPTKHEFIGGKIVAMTGARAGHVRMVRRLLRQLDQHLAGSPCEVFSNDLRVNVPLGDSYYPDIVVVCGDARPSDDTDEVDAATVVIEVLSPSTASYDDTYKRWGYLSLPTLAHFALIAPDRVGAEVADRGEGRGYQARRLTDPDDMLALPAIGFEVRLGDLYRD